MGTSRSREGSWKLLNVFASKVRVEIVRFLVHFEMATLSDISKGLNDCELGMSLPGLFKHMGILEEAGIVRKMSGGLALEVPDARKTLYLLEGKERVERILHQLENNVSNLLLAGETFNKTSKVAKKVQEMGPKLAAEEKKLLETLLKRCDSKEIFDLLTEDEKKKVKLWKIMMTF